MQPARTIDLVLRLAREKREAEAESDPEALAAHRSARIERHRAEAAREFENARAGHLRRCGLAHREVDAVLSGLDPYWRAVRAVEAFWQDPGQKFLTIAGVPGCGKTLASASLFLKLSASVADPDIGERRYWILDGSYRLAGHLADRPPFDPLTARDTNGLCYRRLLVVDELGCEKAMSDPWRATFDEVVDSRYRDRGRKTVLLTNISATPGKDGSPAPFRERYGDRVWRRIREAGRILSLGCVECARGPACSQHRKETA